MKNRDSKLNNKNLARFVLPVIGIIIILGIWEMAIFVFKIPKYVLPTPRDILINGFIKKQYFAVIWDNAKTTIIEAILGYLIGISLGLILSIIFSQVKLIREMFLPFVVASQTVPVIAFAPIIIIWFGSGILSKIIVVAFLTFFPICLGTLKGIQSVDRIKRDLFYCYAATKRQILTKLEFKFAMPYIFTQIRVITPTAVIGAIIAEFIAANKGLGYLTIRNWYTLSMSKLWATIFSAALTGIILYLITSAIEKFATPWHVSQQEKN